MAAFIFFKHEKPDKIVGEATQGIFGKLPSPNGNSSDNYYHGWIQLNSVTQTVTRAIESGRSGTARARAGCVLEDIEVEKEVDTTTTVLLEACSGLIVEATVFAYSFDVNLATGTWLKSGSPRNRARSRYARRIASIRRCRAGAVSRPFDFMSNGSRMLSISMRTTPPELGGGIETISKPL